MDTKNRPIGGYTAKRLGSGVTTRTPIMGFVAASLLCLNTYSVQASEYIWFAGGPGAGDNLGPFHEGTFYRVAYGRDWAPDKDFRWGSGWQAQPFWSMTVGYALPENGTQESLDEFWDLGASLNLRFSRQPQTARRFFADIGVGLHWVSQDHFGDVEIATQYQFCPTFAFGLQGERWEFGYQLWHLSNAGLKEPNPGLNFHLLRVGYRLN